MFSAARLSYRPRMPPDAPRPDRIIPFYSLALPDLVHPKAVLIVWCGACRREARLEVIPLLGRLGHRQGVRDLNKALTCSACSRKGFANVRVEMGWTAPGGSIYQNAGGENRQKGSSPQ